MPIQYKNGVNFEHNHVRTHVGVFDVSHMAQIMISGSEAFQLIQKLTTNDVSKLSEGKVQYSCMLNYDGGIIDDLLVYCINNESYMLVVNAINREKDFTWIMNHNNFNCSVKDVTDEKGLLAIQGPRALDLLQILTDLNLSDIPYYSFKVGAVANCQNIIISNTGYTGEIGFELYMKKSDCVSIWEGLFSVDSMLEPIGLGARDTLRLEMGYCLYGNDINDKTSPIEANLSWIVNMNKDFIGKTMIVKHISEGVANILVGFIMNEKGIPRKGYDIVNDKGDKIGVVTSGTMSPSLRLGVGMGYVLMQESKIENFIYILVRSKPIKAKIVKRPFYGK